AVFYPSSTSRNNRTATVDRFVNAEHELRSKIVLLADVFKQFVSRNIADVELARPRRRVSARIIDRHFVSHIIEIHAGEAFDHIKLLSMRMRTAVEPKSFIVANRIDHQGIAFPVTDVVSIVTRRQILWMFPAIHVNDPVGMRTADVENEDTL